MKNQKILLAAALLALGAASCQKEENVITQFTAGMEQSSAKTYLDGQLLKWVSGDQVKVYSSASDEGSVFTAAPRTGDATWADLSGGTIAEGSSYTAIYPASIAASATSVTLPAVQTSPDGSLAGFPMYAESSNTVFQSKNLCGALRIHLEPANCTISRIKVTAGSAINGTYAVSTTTEGIPSLVNCTNGSNTTTLELGTAQPIANGRDFYVYLPAGEYSNMQLTFYQPDGTICTKSGSVTVERSVCTPVEITNSLAFAFPEDCIGLFSVSATKQVYFSNGNLQCNLQYVSGAWRFAEHQYDYLGAYSATAWDLFGWSTAATTYGMSTSKSTSVSNLFYSGAFVDWGTAIGDGTTWRTLSRNEWNYVLFDRLGAAAKKGAATVAGIHGMILLPDTWTAPSGVPAFVSGYNSRWATNQYTAAEWSDMEAAGAVFLPAAGFRYGSGMYHVGTLGYYWSSTPGGGSDGNDADGMLFNDSGVYDYGIGYRCYGQSVRLVQDY